VSEHRDAGCSIQSIYGSALQKAIAQGIAGIAVFVAFIFLAAASWHYWRGWLFIGVFSASTIGFTTYLALYDRPPKMRWSNQRLPYRKRPDMRFRSTTILPAEVISRTTALATLMRGSTRPSVQK